MERKLALWFGVPFIALAGTFLAVNLMMPGLIHGGLFIGSLFGLGVMGLALTVAHAVIKLRSGESPLVALSSIIVIVVVIGSNFYKEIYVLSLGLLMSSSMDSFERGEGMRFTPASDGRYHPRVVIGGNVFEFVMDTGVADIVLTAEDAKRLGIDPSTLTFDGEIKTAGAVEKVAAIRLDHLQLGSIVIKDIPAKVTAGNAPGNVLGMAFFDRLSAWEIRNGMLMIVP